MIKLENKTWGVTAGITQKSWGALFPLQSLQKTKMKTKTHWMGILISKKACSIIRVFVVTTIIKAVIMTGANNNNNDNNSNNNNSSNNNNNNNSNNNNSNNNNNDSNRK